MSSTQEGLEEILEVDLNFMAGVLGSLGVNGTEALAVRTKQAEILIPHINLLINQARKEAARKAVIKELEAITKYPTAVIFDGNFEKNTLVYIKDIQDRIKALKEGK